MQRQGGYLVTRREFLGYLAAGSTTAGFPKRLALAGSGPDRLNLKPYRWEGPYAEFRNQGARHDWRLCAELRAAWMEPKERLILRTSEIVGHAKAFLYDDHFPPAEPDGRGKEYHHIAFQWREKGDQGVLSADCPVPGQGRFRLDLSAHSDYLEIRLAVRNELPGPMGNIDWHFCVVGFESPSFSDPERKRTFLHDGERLRTLSELSGGPRMELFKVKGAGGFVPVGHDMLPVNPSEAGAPIVLVESKDKRHVAALAFERAYTIYGDPVGNKCFHADPYFGPLEETGEERELRGRLYVMKGTAREAFDRYVEEFQKPPG